MMSLVLNVLKLTVVLVGILASPMAHGRPIPTTGELPALTLQPSAASPSVSSSEFRAWNRANNPHRIYESFESRLQDLPMAGTARHRPWSDTYWPSRRGGAAYRWAMRTEAAAVTSPHSYRTYAAEEIGQLSDARLAALSPAEKYDIINGRFDYPTVEREVRRTSPDQPNWNGLCHAVASANTNFREPRTRNFEVRLPNGSVRMVPMYSSDIKAILAMAIDDAVGDHATYLGQRCNSDQATESGACWDTNPASFFIAIANSLGVLRDTIILDVDSNSEVWNSSAYAYTATVTPQNAISPNAAEGTVRQVRVQMDLQHTIGSQPQQNTVGGQMRTTRYVFTLELAENDEIIGGEWISANRPDFLWRAEIPGHFTGYYDLLEQMIEHLPR